MIEKNVGGYDRLGRGVLAVLFAAVGAAAVAGVGPASAPWGPIAGTGALVVSAGFTFNFVTKRCFGNHLLGIDTCPPGVDC